MSPESVQRCRDKDMRKIKEAGGAARLAALQQNLLRRLTAFA
jgi:hypothetical protein